jgi:hypothetical protein
MGQQYNTGYPSIEEEEVEEEEEEEERCIFILSLVFSTRFW